MVKYCLHNVFQNEAILTSLSHNMDSRLIQNELYHIKNFRRRVSRFSKPKN